MKFGNLFSNRNPPIEFDLHFHRELLVEATKPEDVVATGFNCTSPDGSRDARRPGALQSSTPGAGMESGTRQMQAWLARLVGQYAVEGYVDPCGQGNPEDQLPVTGEVDCLAAGSPPSVHCKVNISWPPATNVNDRAAPGVVSHLAPAQFLFSLFSQEGKTPNFVPTGGDDRRGLYFLTLDSRNVAEWAASELVNDAFLSRQDCHDIPDNCHKTTRIIAKPDSNEISMQVDIEADRQHVRQVFVLRRKADTREN